MSKRNYGLQELPPDDRDFALGAYQPLPPLEELPEALILPFIVKSQGNTDFCSAYATCAVSEVQEKVELVPEYTFAMSKAITGNIDSWGQDLRSACKAHVKYGGLDKRILFDDAILVKPAKELRQPGLWAGYISFAKNHRKQSYFKVTGQYDAFDNIRATIATHKTPVAIGIQFGYPLNQIHINKIQNGFGHAMTVIGYVRYDDGEQALIVGNSYGTEAGSNGLHYITREVINHWVDKYGAFTFIDVDPTKHLYNQKYGIAQGDNWAVQLWKIIKTITKYYC